MGRKEGGGMDRWMEGDNQADKSSSENNRMNGEVVL